MRVGGEAFGAGDIAPDAEDARDAVERAEFSADDGEGLDGAGAGEFGALFDGDVRAELALHRHARAIGVTRDLAGDEELVAAADAGDVEAARSAGGRELDAEFVEACFSAHWYSPRRVLTTFSNSSEL